MTKYSYPLILSSILVCISASVVYGGGPLHSYNGRPVVYPESSLPLSYSIDPGTLGAFTGPEAVSLVDECFAVIQAVPTSHISFENAGLLPEDIDETNYDRYLDDRDGFNAVIFDSDGLIIDSIFGAGASQDVIGFAGSEIDTATGFYTEGSALLNGRFSTLFSHEQFKATFVHEFGHFIGLDHCQINTSYANDGNTANDIYIPTMFPTATDDDTSLGNLNPDDKAALTLLYPGDGALQNAYGRIQGTVAWRDGSPVLGANIVAVFQGDEQMSRFSSISDYYQQRTGRYNLLVPPGTYRIYIEPVNAAFSGGSSVGPYAENPLSASFIRSVKSSSYATAVTVEAGETVEGIDFTARPAPAVPCPAEFLLGERHPGITVLKTYSRTVLAHSVCGRTLARFYYRHAARITSQLVSHPRTAAFCKRFLSALVPYLEAHLRQYRRQEP